MRLPLWDLVAPASNGPFGLVALIAGGVVGALLRIVLARALPGTARSPRAMWTAELAMALGFGALLAVPLVASGFGTHWVGSSLGGALTAYSAACAVYAFLRAQGALRNPIGPAVAHFLASTVAATIGLVGVVLLWRLTTG